MKKLILLMFLSIITLNAQDREPSPWNFRWDGSANYRPFEPDSFKQTSIISGFQWSGNAPMDNALFNNGVAGGHYYEPTENRQYPFKIIVQPNWWDATSLTSYPSGSLGTRKKNYVNPLSTELICLTKS